MMELPGVFVPRRVVPGLNERGHWATREMRRKTEREVGYMAALGVPAAEARVVTFTRYAPGFLDSDNLPQCFKHVRDGIAVRFCVNDSISGPIRWHYRQEKTKAGCYGIRIEFSEL